MSRIKESGGQKIDVVTFQVWLDESLRWAICKMDALD